MAISKKLLLQYMVMAVLFTVIIISPNTIVRASDCTVEAFSVTPNSSPQSVGTVLSLYGRGNCSGGIRASRFNIDGVGFGEDAGAPEQSETWAITEGAHTICFEISGGPNAVWENAARSCMNITGQGNAPPPQTGNCTITSYGISPTYGPVGTIFSLHVAGQCDNGVRAVRFLIDGTPFGEFAGPVHTTPWSSTGYSPDIHTIGFQVVSGDWATAATQYVNVDLSGNPPPPPPAPTPISPLPPAGPSADCRVVNFRVIPSYGSPGSNFNLVGQGRCNNGVRAVRFLINGVPFGEFGGPDHTAIWSSQGYAAGEHQIGFQVTSGDWSQAATAYFTLYLGNTPPQQPPEPPSVPPSGPSNPPTSNRPPAGNVIIREVRVPHQISIGQSAGVQFVVNNLTNGGISASPRMHVSHNVPNQFSPLATWDIYNLNANIPASQSLAVEGTSQLRYNWISNDNPAIRYCSNLSLRGLAEAIAGMTIVEGSITIVDPFWGGTIGYILSLWEVADIILHLLLRGEIFPTALLYTTPYVRFTSSQGEFTVIGPTVTTIVNTPSHIVNQFQLGMNALSAARLTIEGAARVPWGNPYRYIVSLSAANAVVISCGIIANAYTVPSGGVVWSQSLPSYGQFAEAADIQPYFDAVQTALEQVYSILAIRDDLISNGADITAVLNSASEVESAVSNAHGVINSLELELQSILLTDDFNDFLPVLDSWRHYLNQLIFDQSEILAELQNVEVCVPNPEADLDHEESNLLNGGDSGLIINLSSSCSYDVGLAAYQRVDDVIDNQVLFDMVTTTIAPGGIVALSVNLPACATQVDLFYGEGLLSLNGQRYGNRLIAARNLRGNNFCTDVVEYVPPSAPVSGSNITDPLNNSSESLQLETTSTVPMCLTSNNTIYVTPLNSTMVCQITTNQMNASVRHLDSANIGIQSVIDQGVIQAVDVSGWIGDSVALCFAGRGGILFLDASGVPRVPVWMPVVISGEFTCVTLATEGTVVLVENNDYVGAESSIATGETPRPLSECRVTTNYILNFRDSPSSQSEVIGQVPYNYTMLAIARTDNWFNVIFGDDNGWISASHVTIEETCE